MKRYLSLLVLATSIGAASAFQVGRNDNRNRASASAESRIQEEIDSVAPALPFESSTVVAAPGDSFRSTIDDLLQNWSPKENGIACLFVSRAFRKELTNLVKYAQETLGSNTKLLTVVGGGVVGGGFETEEEYSMSYFGGELPSGSTVELFGTTAKDVTDQMESPLSLNSETLDKGTMPSHLLFADPHFHGVDDFLKNIDGIVAGGISVANPFESSLAVGTEVLPPGSLIGATFSGNAGLQVVVSRGCRPVGPTYRVTSVEGPVIHELDDDKAFDRLQDALQIAKQDSSNGKVFQMKDFLGGIHKPGQEDSGDEAHEFTMRQMTGFRPRTGSIIMCGPQIQEGDLIRFHVQSKEIALEDWQSTLKQVETERMFLGQEVGTTLGALQISCMGRGEGLFGVPNVDLQHVERLLPPNTPVAGVMANAEIGPPGIRMGAPEACRSVLHGFASVVVMLCDYSSIPPQTPSMTLSSSLANSTMAGVWE